MHVGTAALSGGASQRGHQTRRCDFADSLVAGIAYIDIAGAIYRHALRVEESRRTPDAIIGAGQPAGSGQCGNQSAGRDLVYAIVSDKQDAN